MKRLQKKIAGAFFFGLALLPYLLLSFFLLQQQALKWEKCRELRQLPLQTVVLSLAEVHWFEAGKELIIDNKLFDVADWTVGEDTMTVTGLFDGDETKLLSKLNKLSGRQKSGKFSTGSFLQVLLASFYQKDRETPSFIACYKRIHPEKPIPPHQSPVLPIPSPPPQACPPHFYG